MEGLSEPTVGARMMAHFADMVHHLAIDFLVGRLLYLFPSFITYKFKTAPAYWATLSAFVYDREAQLKAVRQRGTPAVALKLTRCVSE